MQSPLEHTQEQSDLHPAGNSFSRRSLVKSLAGLGVAAAVLTPPLALVSPTAARSTDSLIVNTPGARLRSGPGTGYRTLASLAKGTEVRYLADGGSANGYRWYKVRVLATGKEGFVAASLLSAPDGGTSPDPVIIGTARTTAAVNLRSGPSTSHQVLRVVPSGATVKISGTVRNGFRYVTHNGLAGWIADQYLASDVPGDGPYDPNYATTTAALNLRTEPSLSARVLLVMPEGARVRLLEGGSGQFRKVSYNGTVGWAAYAYLN
jgi:D-alanyl-D-alanine carboxypeptidase